MQKITLLFTFLITLALSTIVIVFFDSKKLQVNAIPKELYQVYLAGEKIGIIKSKAKLEAYIDKQQETIKKKYNVKNVYPPKDLNIQKYVSYNAKAISEEEMYNRINEKAPFTVKGWTYRIIGKDGEPDKIINVIDKEVFDNASRKTVEAFIPKDEYQLFLDKKQTEIKNTGKIIEDVYIPPEEVLYKQNYISANEHIFIDETELARYLLFGTTDEQEKYIVKKDDTIEDIAFNHKLGIQEFLIVNPRFSNPNTLLVPGQEVSVGLIKPIVNVVIEEHIVEDQVKKFETETINDSNMAYGMTEVIQQGVDGVERVVIKRQTTNGVITNVQIDRSSSQVIKEPIKKIVHKGTKRSDGTTVISPDGNWVWPTNTPYIITSYYGYRWGSLHAAIDISGTGYGSPIKAARTGTIHKVGYDGTRGNYIIVAHDSNYYTVYLHLSKKYVVEGQSVVAGQIIGAMGNSGYVKGTSGTHLHFGVHVGEPYTPNSKTVNPLTLYR